MTAAAGEYNAADRGSTCEAGRALAAIDAMLELEESFVAVGIDIVGNRRPPEGDSLAQHFTHRSMQLAELRARDGDGAAAGADAGAKQRLVGIDVADSAQQLLIQERAL